MTYFFKVVDGDIRFIESGRAISLMVIQLSILPKYIFLKAVFLENVNLSHPLLIYIYLNLQRNI